MRERPLGVSGSFSKGGPKAHCLGHIGYARPAYILVSHEDAQLCTAGFRIQVPRANFGRGHVSICSCPAGSVRPDISVGHMSMSTLSHHSTAH